MDDNEDLVDEYYPDVQDSIKRAFRRKRKKDYAEHITRITYSPGQEDKDDAR